MTTILGAGLSGLIAATQFHDAEVYEANGYDAITHRAVLRFRSPVLSNLVGIPFRKVTVRKSIWMDGCHVLPNIQLANLYSRKTNGAYLDRSIWNLDPVERYIAPETLQQDLAEIIGNRINWNSPIGPNDIDNLTGKEPVISTLPMPMLMDMLGHVDKPHFAFKSIVVDRYRVHGADVHQTVYFPSLDSAAYRASITGDMLIVERSGEMLSDDIADVCGAFGVHPADLEVIEESHKQRYGKIAPLASDYERRAFIYETTTKHNIYSLGRFAVWRNILLDDVVHDTAVIKRLILQGTYGASLHHHQKGQQ